VAQSGGGQGVELTSAFGAAAEVHGPTASAAFDANDPMPIIDASYGDCGVEFRRHSVLLVFGAPCQRNLLAGQEHGRTIPLADPSILLGPLDWIIASPRNRLAFSFR
jgi:hypothetical protein